MNVNREPSEDAENRALMLKSGQSRRIKYAIVFLLLLVVALVVALIVVSVKANDAQEIHTCPGPSTPSQLTPIYTKSGDIFRDLTVDEITRVHRYMLDEPSLNMVRYDEAAFSRNFIYCIELQNPLKDEALKYLDENGPKPTRKANVVVFRGAESPPYLEEVLVDLSGTMRHERNRVLTDKNIPFNARPVTSKETKVMDDMIYNFTKRAYKILKESYDGYTYHNCTTKCLTTSESGPVSLHRSGERRSLLWFIRDVPGIYLHPVGLELLIQREGSDTSKWAIEKIYYSKTIFNSVDEFIESYENGSVAKVFLPAPTKDELLFSTFERRGKHPQPSKPLRGPEQYEPDGKRFTVDNNHVEYMGWSFDYRVRTTSGPQLFDIRFNGERIVYELSLQEAAAFYGSYSPMQSYTDYLDSMWGAGATFELVKGVDCPHNAVYLDVVHFVDAGKPGKRKNALCIFEHNTGIPLRRHYDNNFNGGFNFYGGTPGYSLVVRVVVTPYNYDYIYDFIFHPDGAIQGKVSTTGYIQSTFWTPEEGAYGTEVHKNVAGSVHDHLLHFKIDLDIAGRKNSYEKVNIKLENISSPWYPNTRHIQKHVVREVKTTEMKAAYKFDFDRPCYLNFFNPSVKNAQGYKRGYRIQLNGIMKQLYPETWDFTNAFQWSFYQMAVTKYKWNEDRSTSIYNQNDVFKPVVEFKDFIEDDENIENQDLVAWVSVGLMHVPHAEDIPVTPTTGNNAGFFIRPFNYFDENPSSALRDTVNINPGPKYDTDKGLKDSVCTPPKLKFNFYGKYN